MPRFNTKNPIRAINRPVHQPLPGLCVRTMALILSVTDVNVCPGARTGRAASWVVMGSAGSILRLLDRGVGVAQARQISGARPGVQVPQQSVLSRLCLELGHLGVGIVDVTEHDRLRRARLLAGSHDLAVPDDAILSLRLYLDFLDALHAVGALLHDPPAANTDVRIPQS